MKQSKIQGDAEKWCEGTIRLLALRITVECFLRIVIPTKETKKLNKTS